jgi:site-specific recombinase XerD
MFSNKDKQVTRSWVHRKLNELCAEANINKKIGTHTPRRSRASHMLGKEVSLARVSKMLRHKNPATTMLYLKITTADIWKELEKKNSELAQGSVVDISTPKYQKKISLNDSSAITLSRLHFKYV